MPGAHFKSAFTTKISAEQKQSIDSYRLAKFGQDPKHEQRSAKRSHQTAEANQSGRKIRDCLSFPENPVRTSHKDKLLICTLLLAIRKPSLPGHKVCPKQIRSLSVRNKKKLVQN